MRPIFIYHYEQDTIRKQDEFQELYVKEGQKWEQLYLSEHPEILGKDPRSMSAQSIVIRQIGSMAGRGRVGSHFNPLSGANTVIDG